MALKGTLKDFGIADILQLIGQQQKTGALVLKSKDQQVKISFNDGAIVRAESTTRRQKDLLGAMLLRAELISEDQLQNALEIQKRSLQKLGDALVTMQALSEEQVRKMYQLQTTETLYALFMWKSGSYEFEPSDTPVEGETLAPMRAESVLMEGFRMVDEWPVVKRLITSYQMTFERQKELPPPAPERNNVDDALDDAFEGGAGAKSEFSEVGDGERVVYRLIAPGRDVRKLIDLSCLGEFETCKALSNLVQLGYLKSVQAAGKAEKISVGESSTLAVLGRTVGRVLLTLLVLAVLAFLATRLDAVSLQIGGSSAFSYSDPALQRFISKSQLARIGAAVEAYRLEKGQVPEKLEQLVEAGLLLGDDLRYPWHDGYYYRRVDGGHFVLLPPLR